MRARLLALLLAVCGPAAAQTPVSVVLSGKIAHPRTLSAADLSPVVTVEVPASAKPDAPKTQFGGALLWPLLDGAGWVDAPGRKTHLQHVIMAHGRDGYVVALAIAEIDPGFEGKQVLIATTQDGKPLASPELVVPGDRRAGRRVHDLVGIEVQ
jgi:hypothetical protein